MTSSAIVATGLGAIVLGGDDGEPACDPTPFLKQRKSRKFMGVQDDLAVVAAGRALANAGNPPLGERAGLYASVGFIPFDEPEVERILAGSIDDEGRFSMARFSTDGMTRAHPLITFRCLPNMPAYHVSVNYDVQGPYRVAYPCAGQLGLCLEEAIAALQAHEIDVALALGVAHQRNFLVVHHFSRIDPPIDAAQLRDAGGCIVLEREEDARARGATTRARSIANHVEITASRAIADDRAFVGPASLPIALARATRGHFAHSVTTHDGLRATSRWEIECR